MSSLLSMIKIQISKSNAVCVFIATGTCKKWSPEQESTGWILAFYPSASPIPNDIQHKALTTCLATVPQSVQRHNAIDLALEYSLTGR